MMKNLAIITKGSLPMPPVKGGAVETLLDLFLKENKDNDIFFTVYSIYDENAIQNENKYINTKFEYINQRNLLYKIGKVIRYIINRNDKYYFGNQFIFEIIKKIKNSNLKFDAYLLENCPEYSLPLRKEIKNAKIIQHIHNDYIYDGGRFSKKIIETSDLFLVVSNYIKSRLSTVQSNKKDNIEILYNGTELKSFQYNISEEENISLRKRYGILKSDILVIYSGRLQPHKGVKELFLAMKKLAQVNDKIKLLVVGGHNYSSNKKTPYVLELESIADKLDNIIFTGYIDYNDINKYYKISDISVVPSLWEEPFGLTCLEAIASSLPVIATNVGGLSEVVDEECGILIKKENIVNDLVENISLLATNYSLRKKMGEKGKIKSTIFSANNYSQNFSKHISKYL